MAIKIYDGKVTDERGRERLVDFRKYSVKDTGGRSLKKHEEGMARHV